MCQTNITMWGVSLFVKLVSNLEDLLQVLKHFVNTRFKTQELKVDVEKKFKYPPLTL